MDEPKTTRCTHCRSEFSDAEIAGASCCPVCKTVSIPMGIADDVQITINWHEMRILGIWASNWAIRYCPEESRQSLAAILHSIACQHPELAVERPLTLAGELGILRRAAESGELTGTPQQVDSNITDLLDPQPQDEEEE